MNSRDDPDVARNGSQVARCSTVKPDTFQQQIANGLLASVVEGFAELGECLAVFSFFCITGEEFCLKLSFDFVGDCVTVSLGLADFDVTSDENGTAAVRAGMYLSDNIYTDVTIGISFPSDVCCRANQWN